MKRWIVGLALVLCLLVGTVATSAHAAQLDKSDLLRNYSQRLRQLGADNPWLALDTLLLKAIEDKAFPGCVAAVGDENGFLYLSALGRFTYGIPPPRSPNTVPNMTLTTLFDMASVTKVLATTTAVAQFYQRGELGLDDRISDPKLLGPSFAANGKAAITVRHLLLHNSGFPADPYPGYADTRFGCPESSKYHPELAFSCHSQIFKSLLDQPLSNPVGKVMVYSDLSMITMMYVIGRLARNLGYVRTSDLIAGCDPAVPGSEVCFYEAYVRRYVFDAVGMPDSGFLPSPSVYDQCAPAWNETDYYRHEVIQGVVSDSNAYALGGISGHAGLFSNVFDVYKILYATMFGNSLLNRTTVELFTHVGDVEQSSRALGWDTNEWRDSTKTPSCGDLSTSTYLHLGYTGTQVCNDPKRKIFTILLTNRVYPSTSNLQISGVRNAYNSLVRQIYDQTTASRN